MIILFLMLCSFDHVFVVRFKYIFVHDIWARPRPGQAEELEEVTQELKKKDEEAEMNSSRQSGLIPAILVQAFTLTFLAEWGDRSQIAIPERRLRSSEARHGLRA